MNHKRSLFIFSFRQSKIILSLCVVLLLTGLLSSAVIAQQSGTVNGSTPLNVRSGPGTSYGVISRLSGGSTVTILGSDNSGAWYRVTSSAFSGEGWVYASYIRNSGAAVPNTANTSTATGAAPAATTAGSTTAGSTVVARSARLNVRNGPGTSYGVISGVAAGTTMEVLSRSGDWLQVRIPGVTDGGWVFATLTSASGTPAAAASAASVAPAPAAPAPVAPAPASAPVSIAPAGGGNFSFGIQANMWQGDKAGSIGAVKDLGFTWVKQQIRWEHAEHEQGAIQWQEMDDIINNASGNGINVLFSVVTAPPWTRPNKGGTGGPPEDFNLFANFVGQIASRYCGRLGAIEVWNEQNLQREWEGYPIDPGTYMDLLRRAYGAIKGGCPAMLVISGATTPAGDSPTAMDDINYLRGMYNNGLASYSDGIGIHPSGFGNPPGVSYNDFQAGSYNSISHVTHRSFYFRSTLEESRAVMVQYGDTGKRLWPTEFGWASSQSPHPGYEYAGRISEAQQAQYITEAFRFMANSGYVGTAFLWNLNYHDGEMGQFAVAGRPAYGALKSLTGR